MFALALALACARHPGLVSSPEGCEAGDLAMCRALAAKAEDLPTGTALDRWACDREHAPSCTALAEAEPSPARTRALAAACLAGDGHACAVGADLPDAADDTLALGVLSTQACERGDRKACARAETMGWRGPEVRGVEVHPGAITVRALLEGGTPIVWYGDRIHAWTASGHLDIPTPATDGTVDPGQIRHIQVTPDGHLLAQAIRPLMVWNAMTGVVTRLDTWPRDPDSIVQSIARDGSAVAARLDGMGILTWALPEGGLLGVVPDPGKGLAGLRVGSGGRRLALVGAQGWWAAEPGSSPTIEPRTGPWEGWLAGVELPAGTPDRASVSPDGRLVAVPEADGLRLLRPDGAEVGRVRLPPHASDHRVLHAPIWSPDGGRVVVYVEGTSVVIATSTARGSEVEDRALLARVGPLPMVPPAGSPALVGTADVRGTVTVGGQAVAGAEVTAEPCVAPQLEPTSPRPAPIPALTPRTARTGPDGAFEMAGIARGCWQFGASGPGGMPADKDRFTVGKDTVTLALIAQRTVSGVVLGSDGRPAAGATVRARLMNRIIPNGIATRAHIVTATTTTDAKGRFTLDHAPAEAFTLEALRGGEAFTTTWPGLNKAKSFPEIRLKPALIVEAEENPHSNHTVVVARRAGARDVEGVMREGSWIGTEFAAGDVVTLSIRQLRTEGPAVTVTLPTAGPIQLQAIPMGQLRVRTPAGGRVWLENSVQCEVRGDSCLTQWLPVGTYRVGVHAPDHRIGVALVELSPGAPTEVEVPLTVPTATVVGRVVDARGRPVPGVFLETPCGRIERSGFTTGPDGRFRIEGVAAREAIVPFGGPDLRVLRIQGDGWASLERELEVPVGGGELNLGDVVLTAG